MELTELVDLKILTRLCVFLYFAIISADDVFDEPRLPGVLTDASIMEDSALC